MTFCELTGVSMTKPADSDEFRCPECNIETAPCLFHICRTPKVIDILREQLKDYEVALEFYANSKDWAQFISSDGGLFDEQDGDPVMAFRNGDDCPWETARAALEKYKPKEMK